MTETMDITINDERPILAKPGITLQEEGDNWGILYNPEKDFSFSINPVSVFIWKQLKQKQTIKQIAEHVHANCTDVPGEVGEHVTQFVKQLVENGLAIQAAH